MARHRKRDPRMRRMGLPVVVAVLLAAAPGDRAPGAGADGGTEPGPGAEGGAGATGPAGAGGGMAVEGRAAPGSGAAVAGAGRHGVAGGSVAAPAGPVADAAMAGDLERVRALVQGGADVNAAQGDGMTALHWAAVNGDPDMTRVLLDAGARTTTTTRNGAYRPLHLASRHGHGEVVRALLDGGADAHASTGTAGTKALHLAALSGSVEAVRALLEHGAEVDAAEAEWEQTPLIFAAAMDRVAAMRVLLEHGADPMHVTRVVDLAARAAVDGAARQARNTVLDAVTAGGTERPTPAQMQAAVHAAQRVQQDAAAAEPPEERELEDGEIALNVSTQGGMTPLLHAVRQGHVDAARVLLEAGADLEQARLGDDTPPLLMAVINGHYDLALELLERGADPNRAGVDGAAPLVAVLNNYWAPMSRYPQQHAYLRQQASYLDLMEALLEAGADADARMATTPWHMLYTFGSLGVDMAGATAFWRAAHSTDVDAMRLLVRYGADHTLGTVASPGGRGRGAGPGDDDAGTEPAPTGVLPIHAAAGVGYGQGYTANFHRHAPGGRMPSVRYLVEELGHDVTALDLDGYNPIHHAASRGDNGMILYLVERGADARAVAHNGRTTVDMANGPGQRLTPFPATIALLESMGAVNNHRCVSC